MNEEDYRKLVSVSEKLHRAREALRNIAGQARLGSISSQRRFDRVSWHGFRQIEGLARSALPEEWQDEDRTYTASEHVLAVRLDCEPLAMMMAP